MPKKRIPRAKFLSKALPDFTLAGGVQFGGKALGESGEGLTLWDVVSRSIYSREFIYDPPRPLVRKATLERLEKILSRQGYRNVPDSERTTLMGKKNLVLGPVSKGLEDFSPLDLGWISDSTHNVRSGGIYRLFLFEGQVFHVNEFTNLGKKYLMVRNDYCLAKVDSSFSDIPLTAHEAAEIFSDNREFMKTPSPLGESAAPRITWGHIFAAKIGDLKKGGDFSNYKSLPRDDYYIKLADALPVRAQAYVNSDTTCVYFVTIENLDYLFSYLRDRNDLCFKISENEHCFTWEGGLWLLIDAGTRVKVIYQFNSGDVYSRSPLNLYPSQLSAHELMELVRELGIDFSSPVEESVSSDFRFDGDWKEGEVTLWDISKKLPKEFPGAIIFEDGTVVAFGGSVLHDHFMEINPKVRSMRTVSYRNWGSQGSSIDQLDFILSSDAKSLFDISQRFISSNDFDLSESVFYISRGGNKFDDFKPKLGDLYHQYLKSLAESSPSLLSEDYIPPDSLEEINWGDIFLAKTRKSGNPNVNSFWDISDSDFRKVSRPFFKKLGFEVRSFSSRGDVVYIPHRDLISSIMESGEFAFSQGSRPLTFFTIDGFVGVLNPLNQYTGDDIRPYTLRPSGISNPNSLEERPVFSKHELLELCLDLGIEIPKKIEESNIDLNISWREILLSKIKKSNYPPPLSTYPRFKEKLSRYLEGAGAGNIRPDDSSFSYLDGLACDISIDRMESILLSRGEVYFQIPGSHLFFTFEGDIAVAFSPKAGSLILNRVIGSRFNGLPFTGRPDLSYTEFMDVLQRSGYRPPSLEESALRVPETNSFVTNINTPLDPIYTGAIITPEGDVLAFGSPWIHAEVLSLNPQLRGRGVINYRRWKTSNGFGPSDFVLFGDGEKSFDIVQKFMATNGIDFMDANFTIKKGGRVSYFEPQGPDLYHQYLKSLDESSPLSESLDLSSLTWGHFFAAKVRDEVLGTSDVKRPLSSPDFPQFADKVSSSLSKSGLLANYSYGQTYQFSGPVPPGKLVSYLRSIGEFAFFDEKDNFIQFTLGSFAVEGSHEVPESGAHYYDLSYLSRLDKWIMKEKPTLSKHELLELCLDAKLRLPSSESLTESSFSGNIWSRVLSALCPTRMTGSGYGPFPTGKGKESAEKIIESETDLSFEPLNFYPGDTCVHVLPTEVADILRRRDDFVYLGISKYLNETFFFVHREEIVVITAIFQSYNDRKSEKVTTVQKCTAFAFDHSPIIFDPPNPSAHEFMEFVLSVRDKVNPEAYASLRDINLSESLAESAPEEVPLPKNFTWGELFAAKIGCDVNKFDIQKSKSRVSFAARAVEKEGFTLVYNNPYSFSVKAEGGSPSGFYEFIEETGEIVAYEEGQRNAFFTWGDTVLRSWYSPHFGSLDVRPYWTRTLDEDVLKFPANLSAHEFMEMSLRTKTNFRIQESSRRGSAPFVIPLSDLTWGDIFGAKMKEEPLGTVYTHSSLSVSGLGDLIRVLGSFFPELVLENSGMASVKVSGSLSPEDMRVKLPETDLFISNERMLTFTLEGIAFEGDYRVKGGIYTYFFSQVILLDHWMMKEKANLSKHELLELCMTCGIKPPPASAPSPLEESALSPAIFLGPLSNLTWGHIFAAKTGIRGNAFLELQYENYLGGHLFSNVLSLLTSIGSSPSWDVVKQTECDVDVPAFKKALSERGEIFYGNDSGSYTAFTLGRAIYTMQKGSRYSPNFGYHIEPWSYSTLRASWLADTLEEDCNLSKHEILELCLDAGIRVQTPESLTESAPLFKPIGNYTWGDIFAAKTGNPPPNSKGWNSLPPEIDYPEFYGLIFDKISKLCPEIEIRVSARDFCEVTVFSSFQDFERFIDKTGEILSPSVGVNNYRFTLGRYVGAINKDSDGTWIAYPAAIDSLFWSDPPFTDFAGLSMHDYLELHREKGVVLENISLGESTSPDLSDLTWAQYLSAHFNPPRGGVFDTGTPSPPFHPFEKLYPFLDKLYPFEGGLINPRVEADKFHIWVHDADPDILEAAMNPESVDESFHREGYHIWLVHKGQVFLGHYEPSINDFFLQPFRSGDDLSKVPALNRKTTLSSHEKMEFVQKFKDFFSRRGDIGKRCLPYRNPSPNLFPGGVYFSLI